MPLRRLGEGLLVVGMVSIAVLLAVMILAGHEGTGPHIVSVLAFGTTTIGGVLTVLRKLSQMLRNQHAIESRVEEVHGIVDGTKTGLEREVADLKGQVKGLQETVRILTEPQKPADRHP